MRQQRSEAELNEAEEALEREAVGLGQARYEKLRTRDEAATRPGRHVLQKMVEPLAGAIKAFCDEALSGKPTPQAPLAKFIAQLPAEDVAFLTCRVALNAMARGGRLPLASGAAGSLGHMLDRATQSEYLRRQDPKAFARLMGKIERSPFPGRRHVLLRDAVGKAKVTTVSWDPVVSPVKVGALLLMLMEQTTEYVTIEATYRGGKSYNYVKFSDEFLEALEKNHKASAVWAPQCLPMVVPPRPWKNPLSGAYVDRNGLRISLLNSRNINRNYKSELNHVEMPMVYKALNALQETPWRINLRVYETLKQVWDGGLPLGKLPTKDLIPLPGSPWGDGEAPSEEAKKAHRANLARTHDANHKLGSSRRAVVQKLWIAERMGSFERIYFPHVLDFRGRMYPVPTFVNPQADDSGRALLEFADGMELGESGGYWLAVHGANCYGIDKVSYEERKQWVDEHTDDILACAKDPLVHRMWSDADKPWAFLAFCFEWADLYAHYEAGNAPETFVSRLPVCWDGSCNGLQNFSAMLRDPVGGAATNLVPSDKPRDIYQQVADLATAQVERDAARGEVNAQYWIGKVTRGLAKRPTMTLPYGSGRYGFRQQILEFMDKYKLETGKQYLDGGDPFLCSMYLANVIDDALANTVVAARTAMDWLREVSVVAAKDGLPVYWITPAGFPVMQEYKELIGKSVDIWAGDKRLRLNLDVSSTNLDPRKQAQGISPNFVHSLDAAHLMLTVQKAHDGGMRHFAMIHDSYGTHAANAGALNRILREAFVEQYSQDVLQKFRDDIAKRLPEKLMAKLPPLPAVGTLELAVVMDSDYFFA